MTLSHLVHQETTYEIRNRAREAAQKVLDSTWDLSVLPIDPVKISRAMGAEVYDADLKDDLSGLFVPSRGDDPPAIYVDTDESPTRRRFTTAHELGHFVEDGGNGDTVLIDRRRDNLAAVGTDPHEIFANEFAASLLMPEAVVRRLLRAGFEAEILHLFFKVSPQAMKFRLQNLGLS